MQFVHRECLILLALFPAALGALLPRQSTPAPACIACPYLDKNAEFLYHMNEGTSGLSCTYTDPKAQPANPTCSYNAMGALAAGQNTACAATAEIMGTKCPDTGYPLSYNSVYSVGPELYCDYNCANCYCNYQLSPDLSHSVALTTGSPANFCPPQTPPCVPPPVCTACPYLDKNGEFLYNMKEGASGLSCTYSDPKAQPANPTCAYDATGALAAGQNSACAATADIMGAKCPDTGYPLTYNSVYPVGPELYCMYNCENCSCNYQMSADLSYSVALTTGSPANFCPPQTDPCS